MREGEEDPPPALPVREGEEDARGRKRTQEDERGGKRNKEHGKDLETFPVCDYRG